LLGKIALGHVVGEIMAKTVGEHMVTTVMRGRMAFDGDGRGATNHPRSRQIHRAPPVPGAISGALACDVPIVYDSSVQCDVILNCDGSVRLNSTTSTRNVAS
jgi:hypothetical protein